MKYFYASFTSDQPNGMGGWLGAAQLEIEDDDDPVAALNRLGIVPKGNGEIMLLPLDLDAEAIAYIRPYMNRLLSEADLRAIDAVAGETGDLIVGSAQKIEAALRARDGK